MPPTIAAERLQGGIQISLGHKRPIWEMRSRSAMISSEHITALLGTILNGYAMILFQVLVCSSF